MRVYTAPEMVPEVLVEKCSVFLAGSIEQDRADPWQGYVISELSHIRAAVFNPRRRDWKSSLEQSVNNPEFVAQVTWELYWIEQTDVVFFNFDPNTMSPISLAELGYVLGRNTHAKKQDVIVVCPNEFWRRGNVEIMCQHGGFTFYENLQDGLTALAVLLEQKACAS